MLIKKRIVQNIFSDKSSLVLRALLANPKHHWTIPELARKEKVSTGLVMAVFKILQEEGFLERYPAGRFSYTQLREPEKLLEKWAHHYRFSHNRLVEFYSAQEGLLPKMREYLAGEEIPYALTLFSGARLVAPYVRDPRTTLYIGVNEAEAEDALWKIQSRFSLVPPKAGGNICFALPVYKSSVFHQARTIRGFQVVSNLQLYLDLINSPAGGAEQAEWLKTRLKEKGVPIIEGVEQP
ncbi:MAG: hypothetical protein HY548_03395 [Elusimicrobia bacterium]|nr:hypothetical protein [Elusimicrobiota bacterium]